MRLRMVVIASVLGLSAQMAACGDAGSKAARKGEWQSVCLDRLVLDMPMPLEMGASEVDYRGGHNFPGLTGVGGGGVRWSETRVDESYVTNDKGYEFVRSGVSAEVPSQKRYFAAIAAYEEHIEHQ